MSRPIAGTELGFLGERSRKHAVRAERCRFRGFFRLATTRERSFEFSRWEIALSAVANSPVLLTLEIFE